MRQLVLNRLLNSHTTPRNKRLHTPESPPSKVRLNFVGRSLFKEDSTPSKDAHISRLINIAIKRISLSKEKSKRGPSKQ